MSARERYQRPGALGFFSMVGRCAHTLARQRATVRRPRLCAPPRDPLERCDCHPSPPIGRRGGARLDAAKAKPGGARAERL